MSEREPDDAGDKANLVLLLRHLWPCVDDPEAWQGIVWRKFRRKLVYCEGPARGDPRNEGGFARLVGDSY